MALLRSDGKSALIGPRRRRASDDMRERALRYAVITNDCRLSIEIAAIMMLPRDDAAACYVVTRRRVCHERFIMLLKYV